VARFEAVGTAVRYMPDRVPQLGRAPSLHVGKRPFTSDLKATEFATLLQSGYRPVALAMGNCVIQVARMLVMDFDNYEIAAYTKAFMDAREEAMLRLEQDLFKEFPKGTPDAPSGVVGMDVQEHAHANEGVVEYSAVGTAIAPLQQPNPWQTKQLVAPIMVVPLDR
jgi:uncharacterized protein YbjQ (UPF0145 family)